MSESTRGQIIHWLRKSENGLTLDALCGMLHVTPMAVHRQLKVLEGEGYVSSEAIRGKRGRPQFLYRLTRAAEKLFPKTYAQVLIDLLKEIRFSDGANRIRKIFDSRFRQFFQDCDGKQSAQETCEILNAHGYMAEAEKLGSRKMRIKLYNCPTSEVAHEHPEICTSEQCVLAEVLGAEVTRENHILAGQNYCSYRVKKK